MNQINLSNFIVSGELLVKALLPKLEEVCNKNLIEFQT